MRGKIPPLRVILWKALQNSTAPFGWAF